MKWKLAVVLGCIASAAFAVEESEVLAETVEDVRCRWCAGVGTVVLVPRPTGTAGG